MNSFNDKPIERPDRPDLEVVLLEIGVALPSSQVSSHPLWRQGSRWECPGNAPPPMELIHSGHRGRGEVLIGF